DREVAGGGGCAVDVGKRVEPLVARGVGREQLGDVRLAMVVAQVVLAAAGRLEQVEAARAGGQGVDAAAQGGTETVAADRRDERLVDRPRRGGQPPVGDSPDVSLGPLPRLRLVALCPVLSR